MDVDPPRKPKKEEKQKVKYFLKYREDLKNKNIDKIQAIL